MTTFQLTEICYRLNDRLKKWYLMISAARVFLVRQDWDRSPIQILDIDAGSDTPYDAQSEWNSPRAF